MNDEAGRAADPSSSRLHPPSFPRTITFRSITLGLIGGVMICCVAPYNDFVLNNTYLIGNSLPVVVVMTAFVLAVLVNAPLRRWAPKFALSGGEVTCVIVMMLAACAIPGSGVLRYLSPSLVMPFHRARENQPYLEVLEQSDLPKWMFPGFEGNSPSQWMNDPIITGYESRWTGPDAAPYGAWVRPIVSWGVFVGAMFGAVLMAMGLLHWQWVENERLAFPLAQVHLALIEQPAPGHALNNILRRHSFWAAFAIVFFVHIWNGSMTYWQRPSAVIPLAFDLSSIFSEPPWSYTDAPARQASLLLIIAGLTYFLNSSLAFTLWFVFIAQQVIQMGLGTVRGEPRIQSQMYHHFGASLAYAAGAMWIARHHWAMILRRAFGRARPDDPQGRYLSFGPGFWIMIACIVVMIGWNKAAGMTLLGSVVIVLMLLMMFLVVARIVAETGLVFVGVQFAAFIPMVIAAASGLKSLFPLRDIVIGTFVNAFHDLRENIGVYSSHSMAVADQSVFYSCSSRDDTSRECSTGRRIVLAIVLMLAVAYPVGFFAHLRTEYTYASTIDINQDSPINQLGGSMNVTYNMERPVMTYAQGTAPVPFSRAGQTALGFIVTAAVTVMRLTFSWWPIHPVGMVLAYGFALHMMWFSILVGWLAKVLVLRLGGSSLYTQAKPFVLGLVVGESMAIGFWMIVAMVLSALGIPYQTIRVLPI